VCVCVVCERVGERECEKESVWEEGRGKERMCIIEKQCKKRMIAHDDNNNSAIAVAIIIIIMTMT
jgi:hypothetical protein